MKHEAYGPPVALEDICTLVTVMRVATDEFFLLHVL